MRATWALVTLLGCTLASAAELKPCRVDGIETEVQCGSVERPLDPARPQGVQIRIHYLVVPALARNKLSDPVLFLAGGPGQSAIKVAPALLGRFSRLNNRRDLVFVDQRGTGESAPLDCPDEAHQPLAEITEAATLRHLEACRVALTHLPYGDLRMFTTPLAMADMDAVRADLGAPRWNVVGTSYGTRAGLEMLRQHPERIRRLVLDSVAPPDMALPASFSTDSQAALDAMFSACEKEAACAATYPHLRSQWQALLKGLPRQMTVRNPRTGSDERAELTRGDVLKAVRAPLYVPALASALPAAIAAASEGRFEGLLALSGVLASGKGGELATGMHFSVVCAEDVPLLDAAATAARNPPGSDFEQSGAEFYRAVCKNWPRGTLPADFYQIKPATLPVLLLSGGADPATPPRHGERAAKALGPLALHLVVPNAGHGVLSLPCMHDVLYRFIDAAEDADALKVTASCASSIPRPLAFLPIPVAASSAAAPIQAGKPSGATP